MMSYFRELFKQSSYYFISNILAMLAGFVSFPIWTRIFSKSEYGIFSLVSITISLGVGFSKFGLQHAALRYYSDFKEKKINHHMSHYYSTLFIGSLLISTLIILAALLISEIFIKNYIDKSLHELLPLVAFLIFIGSISSILTVFIRADNKGGLWSVFSIATRYGQLLTALIVIFYFMKSLQGLLLGYAFSETIIFIVLLALFIKKININKISFTFLKEALKYGFPLVWMELSNIVLISGDRYLIHFYMGPEAVGVYSVGYNLSNMAQSILVTPLSLAIFPMYLSIWNRYGEKETKKFLNKTLNYYFMLAIPIVIGLSWFDKEIINFLATKKYEEASFIIPYVVLPLMVHGGYTIFASGLFIYKKTSILMHLTLLAAVMNVLFNVIMIPILGLVGAALATLIAYLFLTLAIVINSYKYIRLNVNVNSIIRYTFLSIIVMFFVSNLSFGNTLHILIKIIFVIIAYFIGIIISEKDIRKFAFSFMNKR